MEQLLWYILAGTRGGYNRLRILDALEDRPGNANQLAHRLGLDYRTIRHHLNVLCRNQLLVNPRQDEYGSVYFVSPWISSHPEVLERIRVHVRPSGAEWPGPRSWRRARAEASRRTA